MSLSVQIAECVTPAIAQLVTPPPDEVTLASTSTHLIFVIFASIFSSPLLRYARYLPNICNAQAYLPQLLLLTPTTQPPTYQTMSPPLSTHTGDVTVSHPCHTAVRLLHKEGVTLCNVADPLSHSVQKLCAKHLHPQTAASQFHT